MEWIIFTIIWALTIYTYREDAEGYEEWMQMTIFLGLFSLIFTAVIKTCVFILGV